MRYHLYMSFESCSCYDQPSWHHHVVGSSMFRGEFTIIYGTTVRVLEKRISANYSFPSKKWGRKIHLQFPPQNMEQNYGTYYMYVLFLPHIFSFLWTLESAVAKSCRVPMTAAALNFPTPRVCSNFGYSPEIRKKIGWRSLQVSQNGQKTWISSQNITNVFELFSFQIA